MPNAKEAGSRDGNMRQEDDCTRVLLEMFLFEYVFALCSSNLRA